MKILHLLDSINRGGTETLVLDVCRNARQQEIDLTLLATGGGTLEKDFRGTCANGTEFIRRQRNFSLDPAIVRYLRRIIKEREIQIIHAHQAVEGIHAYAATLASRTKFVLSFHGGSFDLKNRLALKFLIPRAAHNIFVSESSRRWYATAIGLKTNDNFSIVSNGVDQKRLAPSAKDLRRELNLPADSLLFGMIGNFLAAHIKDQMTVCRALPKVFSVVGNAHFVFAGRVTENGAENFRACVAFCEKNRLAERVHFLGERHDVSDILAALDLFVFSSRREGMPIAVAEAMLAGVPVVMTDIEPLLEISNDGKYAEIFKVGDDARLAEIIIELLRDPTRRRALAAKALNHAQRIYSIETHLQNLKKIYESVI